MAIAKEDSMTGKEALRILNQVTEIHNCLIKDQDRSAFYYLGVLSEELAQIIRIDEVSFKPTVKFDEECP